MRKEFDIYVSDHILKWAKKKFWHDQPPFKITEGSLLGMLIFGLLNDKREISVCYSLENESVFRVELSDTLAKRSPDPIKLSHVNSILEKLFKEDLQRWVEAQNACGRPRYQAMIDFFERNDIKYSQRLIERYQKYIQRANSRTYRNYVKAKLENTNEQKAKLDGPSYEGANS